MRLTDEQIRALLADPSKMPPCARHLGFELVDFSVEDAWAQVAFTPRPEFANPVGSVQGGFVAAMLDDTMSFAASLSRRFEVVVPTLQTSVSYLRPTPIARVISRGEVLRFGPSSVVMQGTLAMPPAPYWPSPRPPRCRGPSRIRRMGRALAMTHHNQAYLRGAIIAWMGRDGGPRQPWLNQHGGNGGTRVLDYVKHGADESSFVASG